MPYVVYVVEKLREKSDCLKICLSISSILFDIHNAKRSTIDLDEYYIFLNDNSCFVPIIL